MQFKQKEISLNDKLSLSRNLTNNSLKTTLSVKPQEKQYTNNTQKRILKVYLTEDGKAFIDKTAAYSLGYVDTRALSLDNIKKIEISDRQLAQIKSRENIEIEYEKLVANKEIPTKPKIEVFVDNIDYYISISAAFSLGLISVEKFNNMINELYKISDNLLVFLKNKYDVEYIEITKGKTK